MLTSRVIDARSNPNFDDHERIVYFENSETGLRALIAVHNTALGASLGGCRIYPYADFDAALTDVLRLSKGMTYKSALAGLPLGGGKAVLLADPKTEKTEAMMKSFGEAVEAMNGTYITAEDVGSTEADMLAIASATSFVAGLPHAEGQDTEESVAGNPSPVTAYGVYCGLKACAARRGFGVSLAGRTIAIQGLGAVGFALAEYLVKDGATLIVADVNPHAIERAVKAFAGKVSVADVGRIHAADADIFAPCALGAGLNDMTIPEIRAGIVGGAANNQLAEARHDMALKERGILYAPDYAINSGGITAVGYEYFDRSGRNPYPYALTRARMTTHVEQIGTVLQRVFDTAESAGIGTGAAADRLAETIFKGRSVAA